MKKIQVGLGERSYQIIIRQGMLDEIGQYLEQQMFAKRYVVITDSNVVALYGKRLLLSLEKAGLDAEMITFPAGEEQKNLQTIATLASELAKRNIDRKDGLIALGGGVTGDITGFLAASYMRGICFVQVPTTLLAQVDSSVGGKTGVDIPEGKNLVGAFYQPKSVYIDSLVLKTLPEIELLNGLAEVIKYSIIYDRTFFQDLKNYREQILKLHPPVIEEMIARCCTIKAEVVEKDERESDLRRILNFGHTIGHAIEAESGYRLPHGLAVAIGMVAAAKLAVQKGMLGEGDAQEVVGLIERYNLPVLMPEGADANKIKAYLKTDKKTVGGRPFFVLPQGIGRVVVTDDVEEEDIDAVLSEIASDGTSKADDV